MITRHASDESRESKLAFMYTNNASRKNTGYQIAI